MAEMPVVLPRIGVSWGSAPVGGRDALGGHGGVGKCLESVARHGGAGGGPAKSGAVEVHPPEELELFAARPP